MFNFNNLLDFLNDPNIIALFIIVFIAYVIAPLISNTLDKENEKYMKYKKEKVEDSLNTEQKIKFNQVLEKLNEEEQEIFVNELYSRKQQKEEEQQKEIDKKIKEKVENFINEINY